MIAVWYTDEDSLSTRGPDQLVARLVQFGVSIRRVADPKESRHEVLLMVASPDAAVVTELSEDARSRTVVIAYGGNWEDDWEVRRQASGLLGLVEPITWVQWRGGKYASRGLRGRPDVAGAAGLRATDTGLRAPESLPMAELLARFLLAAERVLGAPGPVTK